MIQRKNPLENTFTNNGNHSFRCISCVHHPCSTFASKLHRWHLGPKLLIHWQVAPFLLSFGWIPTNHTSAKYQTYIRCVIYIIYRYKYNYTSTCLSFHSVSIYCIFPKKIVCFLERQLSRVFFCCSRVIYFRPAYALPTPCLRRCGVFLRGDYLS